METFNLYESHVRGGYNLILSRVTLLGIADFVARLLETNRQAEKEDASGPRKVVQRWEGNILLIYNDGKTAGSFYRAVPNADLDAYHTQVKAATVAMAGGFVGQVEDLIAAHYVAGWTVEQSAAYFAEIVLECS